ncbi:carbohydrate-binding module family 18 protein [Piromyces sp. E2]|nr:carbohydrate-binding module family 18 protein [Piromyces sp. E2]|eukprot:OUM62256.1 carbohydrate-binding module family 18 protein [Piromyces sp. E2]
MKLLFIISLLICTFAFLEVKGEARSYEITHYGCDSKCLPLTKSQKDKIDECKGKECHTTDGPSCYRDENEAFGDGRNVYFSAISTQLDGYKNYCKHYAIVMLLTGEKKPRMIKTRIVDTCTECKQYHLDLGKESFEKLLPLDKGIANVIWGIYTENGEQKKIIYDSNNEKTKKTASAFGVSLNELVNAFSTTAKSLAKSSKYITDISIGNSNPLPTSSKPSPTSSNSKLPTSITTCGDGVAVCAEGYCCSKYGWCGKSEQYCGAGCQPNYGTCNSKPSNRCGPEYGSCAKGLCCSKYGWCDKTPQHCGTGCQPKYGICN